MDKMAAVWGSGPSGSPCATPGRTPLTRHWVFIGVADRDPRARRVPGTFGIARPPVRELGRRLPGLRLAGAPEWAATVTLRGLSSLPVTVT